MSDKVEIEGRGYILKEEVEPFLKSFLDSVGEEPKISEYISTTIFPQSPLDLRIKFRNDKIFLVYKKRKKQDRVDIKVEVEEQITVSDIKPVFKIYSIFKVKEYVVLESYTKKYRFSSCVLTLKYLNDVVLWELETVTDPNEEDTKIDSEKDRLVKLVESLRQKFKDRVEEYDNRKVYRIKPHDTESFFRLIEYILRKHKVKVL